MHIISFRNEQEIIDKCSKQETDFFFTDLPAVNYHALSDNPRFLSQGMLTKHLKSSLHYDHATKEESKETAAKKLGLVVHAKMESLICDNPQLFKDQIFELPKDLNRKTKSGKEAYKAIMVESKGKILATTEELEIANHICNTLLADDFYRNFFKGGESELSAFARIWKDRNIFAKVRADYLIPDKHVINDLKNVKDASKKAFQKAILDNNWHVQAAYYLDFYNQNDQGMVFQHFVYMACETSPPYGVAVYALDQQSIEQGRKLYKRCLERHLRYLERIDSGEHIGYPKQIEPIGIAKWGFYE